MPSLASTSLHLVFCLLLITAISTCERYGALPYQPSVKGYQSEYVNYINKLIEEKSAGFKKGTPIANPMLNVRDNDNHYVIPENLADDNESTTPAAPEINGNFFGTTDDGQMVSPYQDNDSNYYPLKNYGNHQDTKGVYQPFATDNVIPYEEEKTSQDFDENYYPYIYYY